MDTPLLQIKNLSIAFTGSDPCIPPITVVHKIDMNLHRGKMLALVGESGSGKSISALSILRLLPSSASHPEGNIQFNNQDMLQISEKSLRSIRGKRIAMIFQEPMTSLNPLHTIGKQLQESLLLHQPKFKTKPNLLQERIHQLLTLVGLDQVLGQRLSSYPHELSGGQRQRIMIAMALSNDPDILIADEPTTALDVTIQAQILTLLKELQQKLGMAILLITHDLTIVENMADHVAVMLQGKIVEQGKVASVFTNPQHDYTKKLLAAAPKGEPAALPKEKREILSTPGINISFPIKSGLFNKTVDYVRAVNNIPLTLLHGQSLGIVGESGSGKTTLASGLLRLIDSEGNIFFDGKPIHTLSTKNLQPLRRNMQFVFQDPFSSLNPRMTVGNIIGEGLRAHNLASSREEESNYIDQAMIDVGLDLAWKNRFPHEFSGGQRQRIGVARALVLQPKLIVLDEPTSALDLSTQAEILDMLKNLQVKHGLSYIFISHDLRVIKAICHHVLVLKDGELIEEGPRNSVFTTPKHNYTKRLLTAAFTIKDAA